MAPARRGAHPPRLTGHGSPPGLAQARQLEYASRFVPTIEINGSFYALQRQVAGLRRGDGEHELYASGYDDASLARWAARIRAWAKRGDVVCYFDNDIKVRAPFDAKRLMEMVGVNWSPAT